MAVVTYGSAGSGNWLCPANVTSVTVACWGGGGGGQQSPTPGGGGAGGGGGEYASDTVAVIPGTLYRWVVGTGGSARSGAGFDGGASSFAGSTVTVLAHGGKGGGPGPGGGGTGSTSATHFSGGSGGNGAPGGGGGGAGSSAGTAANGANGGNAVISLGGFGGTAPAGGGNGGGGGGAGSNAAAGTAPGGGGGGAGGGALAGQGAHGQVQLTYTVAVQPLVPFFPAGFAPLHSDFDNWIQSPLSFLTSKVVFRAELTTGQALAPAGGTVVINYNSILEDPLSGWQAGSHQWLCPAGYTATYHVAVTASCANNIGGLEVQALAGLNSASALYGLAAVAVPTAGGGGNALASGAVPVQLYGGQDTVQGLAIVTGGAGTAVSTAGQRCELTITWQNQ